MDIRIHDGGHALWHSRRRPQSTRRTCKGCGDHPAVLLLRGEARRDRQHVLGPRCYRSEIQRSAARLLLAS